jgi:hypothetical protein
MLKSDCEKFVSITYRENNECSKFFLNTKNKHKVLKKIHTYFLLY